MERLFLVDQTLGGVGSGDFEYLRCLASAAGIDQRFSVTIGTGSRFRSKQAQCPQEKLDLFPSAQVVHCFRNHSKQATSWLGGGEGEDGSQGGSEDIGGTPGSRRLSGGGQILPRLRSRLGVLWQACRDHHLRLKRRKQIARFACDCNRFFLAAQAGEFRRGDHVFFVNVSELELMGLAVFLANAPSSILATWHLHFRQSLPAGEFGYDGRGTLARKVRGCFMASISRVPDHDLRFYSTSAEIAGQYESLELARFTTLPYPVSPDFQPSASLKFASVNSFSQATARDTSLESRAGSALQIHGSGFEGHSEVHGEASSVTEQSLRHAPVRMVLPVEVDAAVQGPLQRIVERLWEDRFTEGQLQLAFWSRHEKNWWSPSSRNPLISQRKLSGLPAKLGESAIEHLQGPLTTPQQRSLIRESDFAIFLPGGRDSENTRSLAELLSCGKPVLVPAGSFMARQLQPSLDQHINSLRERLPRSRVLELKDLRFGSANVPLCGGVLSFDRVHHPFRAETEKDVAENVAVVRFRCHHPKHASFVKIRCSEPSENGIDQQTLRVVPQREADYCVALFRLPMGGERLQLEFENAFHDASMSIRELSIELFSVTDPNEVRLGSSGLIYADSMTIDEEVVEVMENLDYYRRNAENDSQAWWRLHDPERALERIVGSRLYESLPHAA